MAIDKSSVDLRRVEWGDIPQRLAEAHHRTEVGAVVELVIGTRIDDRTIGDLVVGAGFVALEDPRRSPRRIVLRIQRIASLPDRIVPDLRVLISGLNPSVYAAEVGVGFARPGNRFWPAALASGLMSVDRDPAHALVHHRVGMTDLVKRATARANELSPDEFVAGAERLARVCVQFTPRVLCVAGITGWRAAVDKRAVAGLQSRRFGTTRIYVMANPSGLNAHVTVHDIADELRHVAQLADGDR